MKKDEYRIKQFKDGSNNWWVGWLHYTVLNGEVKLCAGGKETEESLDKITKYLKRKKMI